MVGVGYYEQFLVVALKTLESIFSKIKRVGFLAVHNHHGIADLTDAVKQREIDEREERCDVPAVG